jgi:phospholipid/cholesterol/gamma-HCH transport system permease protein
MSADATLAPASSTATDPVTRLGAALLGGCSAVGGFTLFFLTMLGRLLSRRPGRAELLTVMVQVSVQSLPVVLLTGAFIGMVMSVQTYDQFRFLGLETQLGLATNLSLFKELGPVLAAVMLAGRVGGAMAAEIGTMKVTEQIDALWALGADPIHYLVVPRFVACVLLIPMLAIFANSAGVLGGWFFSVHVLGINDTHYWSQCVDFIGAYDLFGGIFKSVFFGAAISLTACHRGFHCDAGAQGVGKAATEAFVLSFLGILSLDFVLSLMLNGLEDLLWR